MYSLSSPIFISMSTFHNPKAHCYPLPFSVFLRRSCCDFQPPGSWNHSGVHHHTQPVHLSTWFLTLYPIYVDAHVRFLYSLLSPQSLHIVPLFLLFVRLFFETHSHYITQAGLQLILYHRLALNLKQSPCLSLPYAGITGMYHYS